MISFDTTRFGRLEVGKDKIIHFPEGLVGLPDVKRLILMDYKDTFLKWLQSVDNPDIAFIVVPPAEFFPEFSPKVDKQLKVFLKVENEDDLIVFAILRVDGENVTANLQGPLIINSMNKIGVQVLNDDPNFSCKTPLKSLSASTQK